MNAITAEADAEQVLPEDAAVLISVVPGPLAAAAAVAAAPKRRTRIPERDTRVNAQPGFVLHSYPHRETSLIIDVFTRDYGRIALVAKGAKRPLSKLRGVLQVIEVFNNKRS